MLAYTSSLLFPCVNLLAEPSPTSHQVMTHAMTAVQVVGCDLFLGYGGLVWEVCAKSSDGAGKRRK